MCAVCAGISVWCSLAGKNTSAARNGRVIFRTVTPQCLLLLHNLTSGVFLWPFIYFRGLVLL